MPIPAPPKFRFPLRWSRAVLAVMIVAAAGVLTVAEGQRRAQAAVLRADPDGILGDPGLRRTALDKGKVVFADHCASCHGGAGKGDQALGVPDLTDRDFLYGQGRVSEIEDLARHGIRAHDNRGANLASMPAYAQPVPYKGEKLPSLTPAQIEDLTQGLLWFTGRATDVGAARRGQALYRDYTIGCWDCHGEDAGGDAAIGAPTLSDAIWLYGGSHDRIYRTIARGRAGISPAFANVLSAAQLRDVAVYVASLSPERQVSR